MVSDTLCPAVHILGTWNVYSNYDEKKKSAQMFVSTQFLNELS